MKVTVYTKTKTNPEWLKRAEYPNSDQANQACNALKAAAKAQGQMMYCKMEREK